MEFAKRNQSRYADHLLREAHGLEALRRASAGSALHVPNVLHVDEHILKLPLIEVTPCSASHWQTLGEGLAALHAQPQTHFGFDEDNYIGLNPQPNPVSDDWGEFFLRHRLEFQIGLIKDPRRRKPFSDCLRKHGLRLRDFLDAEPTTPSLVHGDLWSGNVLCGEHERVWLIDPAAYFGDPEVDLAMTEMFGAFPRPFYAAYRASRPEPRNWSQKKQIYNLYHYLNHLNIFGQTYLSGCEAGFALLETI